MKRYFCTVAAGFVLALMSTATASANDLLPVPRPRSTRRVTARELEVLALIADGCSTREIAQRLWITDETVRTHVRRLLRRLGARTRAHAVAIAYRDGLWARNGEAG